MTAWPKKRAPHLAECNAGDVILWFVCAAQHLVGSADIRPALLFNHLRRRRQHNTNSGRRAKLAANTPHLHTQTKGNKAAT